MDKLVAMRTFAQIVDKGSLTKAANSLGISAPSVVRTLGLLEKSLGARLLNRTTRRISLTIEGRRYLDRCRKILADIEEAETEISFGLQEPYGELRITAPELFGRIHINPLISDFIRNYKKVSVELLLNDQIVNLIENGIDLAIRIGRLEDSSLIAVPLGHIRRVVCASPEYLNKNGIPKKPSDLVNHSCLQLSGMERNRNWDFVQNGKKIITPVNGRFACNQASATIDACVDGLGIGIFLSYQVQSLILQKKLKLILEEYQPVSIPVSIIYPHSKLLSARVSKFIEHAVKKLRQEFY